MSKNTKNTISASLVRGQEMRTKSNISSFRAVSGTESIFFIRLIQIVSRFTARLSEFGHFGLYRYLPYISITWDSWHIHVVIPEKITLYDIFRQILEIIDICNTVSIYRVVDIIYYFILIFWIFLYFGTLLVF